MNFLPLKMHGRPVYAGFKQRLHAGVVDFLIYAPIQYFLVRLYSDSISASILLALVATFFYAVFSIGFHWRFGATPGKMAAGIKVTLPNGEPIGLRNAIKRSSVDLLIAAIVFALQILAFSQVDGQAYAAADWQEKAVLIFLLLPSWYLQLGTFSWIWVWSEVVTVLFNKRNRALHDFIAGSVVIDKNLAASS